MNYSKIYDSLVAKAQSRPIPDCYTERHHVVPRCLGGSDEATNLVVLTAREHCFAHLLLARIHGGKLWHAANMMTSKFSIKSRAYAIASQKSAKALSEAKKGSIQNPKTKQKIAQAMMGMFVGLKSTSLKGAIQALNLKTGFTTILHGESEIISAGFDHTAVYRCVNGTRKTHKGHIFTRQPLIQSEAAE